TALAPPPDRHSRAVLLPGDVLDREGLHVLGPLPPAAAARLRHREWPAHPPSLLGDPALDRGWLRGAGLARPAVAPPPGGGLWRGARPHPGRVRAMAAAGRRLLVAGRAGERGGGGGGGVRPRAHGRRRAVLAGGRP